MNTISLIKNEDESAFRRVFDEYHKKLYFYIFGKTKSVYLAEETVQLTFIKLWNNRKNLNEDFSISTQLFRIATTTLIDLLRKQNTSFSHVKKLEKINLPDRENETVKKMDLKESNHILSNAMQTLPPMRKKVFEMSRNGGMTYNEIALELSISPKTVENHIAKAIKQIRRFFE